MTTTADLVLAAVVAALVLVAVRLFAGFTRTSRLAALVAPGGRRAATPVEAGVPLRDRVRRAGRSVFGVTETVFRRSRPWQRLESHLERANVPLRAVELAYGMLGAGLAGAVLAALLGASPTVVLGVSAGGAYLPYRVVVRRATLRRRAFDERLPDILLGLAASMKAGHTFLTGIEAVAREGEEPARSEFRRVLQESRLGRPLDESLAAMAARIGSDNFSFVVRSVVIQREVGGSLARIFDMVAETVRERQQFARRVRAATAMGRMSAYVLTALPIALAAILTMMNPDYMRPLFATSTGRTLIAVAVTMIAMGALVLRRIVSFGG